MRKSLTICCLILSLLMLTGCVASAASMNGYQPAAEAAVVPTEEIPAPSEAPAPAAEKITELEAKAIALKDANLTEADVVALEVHFDAEDQEYEVDFRHGDYEYDYSIHVLTGKITEKVKEHDPEPTAPKATDAPKPTEPAPKETKPASTKTADLITKEKAKSIALKDAGVAAGDAKRMECEYDVDDGVKEYEVDFHAGKYEYSYTIHAETGKILSREKEIDD